MIFTNISFTKPMLWKIYPSELHTKQLAYNNLQVLFDGKVVSVRNKYEASIDELIRSR